MRTWVVCRNDESYKAPRYVLEDDNGDHFVHGSPGTIPPRWTSAIRAPNGSIIDLVTSSLERREHYACAEGLLEPGEYHPRIWRPVGGQFQLPLDEHSATSATQAVANLTLHFLSIARNVEPHPENGRTFGHELRQMLILASTEVEAAWRGIFRENDHPGDSTKWNRSHYKKLLPLLRLDEWELQLSMYPSYPPISPFASWTRDGELRWYSAYNAVKHDRESAFREASLENVIDALAACVVMLVAQFGPEAVGFRPRWLGERVSHNDDPDFRTFVLTQHPIWTPEELYVPPFGKGAMWVRRPYFVDPPARN